MKSPNNLVEMVELIKIQKDILSECDKLKNIIDLISNNVVVIGEISWPRSIIDLPA